MANEFHGVCYDPEHDKDRLSKQLGRVYEALSDGKWHTLDELARRTGDPHASISAQIRNLRKPKYGSHIINLRVRGDRLQGLWEYGMQTYLRGAA